MYDFIEGPIAYKNPTFLVINVGGVGYRLEVSLQTYAKVEKEEKARLLTYLHVKEDMMALYGFATAEERKVFESLIKVNGIGTNTARLILSSLQTEEVVQAIQYENAQLFKSVKGIGLKTAQRIILDLKDKIDLEVSGEEINSAPAHNSFENEAFSALTSLGFQKAQISKAMNEIKKKGKLSSVEEYIKEGLKLLSK